MKKLILTINTYDWIAYTTGMILTEKDDNFELLRIFSDQNNSIFWCRNLSSSAIFEQRRYDLNNIGKYLGIKKVASLNYNENIFDELHTKSMITKLKLLTIFNMIEEVYIPNNLLFINIFKEYLNNSKIYVYGNDCDTDETKKVVLEKEIYENKIFLRKLMVGIHKKEELDLYRPIERFHKTE